MGERHPEGEADASLWEHPEGGWGVLASSKRLFSSSMLRSGAVPLCPACRGMCGIRRAHKCRH